jgi:hypothetical protein
MFTMKHSILSILLLCALISNGQTKQTPHPNTAPVFFLDSVRMTTLPHFDLNKIKSLNVVKEYDENTKVYGKVYITTKSPRDFNFLTLEQIAKQSVTGATPCIFMINNELVKDTNNIRIDSSYILKCEISNTIELKYLQNFSTLTILNIKTRSKENLDNEKKIYIRGTETSFIKQ